MKKVTKFLMAALLAGMCSFGYAQTQYEWEKPAKPTEKEVEIITINVDGGRYINYYDKNDNFHEDDTKINYTKEQLYEKLKSSAQARYGNIYPQFVLRNFQYKQDIRDVYPPAGMIGTGHSQSYKVSASVVIPDSKAQANEGLSRAVDKALQNVREGSRLAIDQVSVRNGINREDYKDQLIDMLLDKGYKVVAKEYLAQLYEEQQNQQSGIYNDRTTVQENNFSAVGYYINVKVTETSLRVQVVNVSTGEYEGNATVNF